MPRFQTINDIVNQVAVEVGIPKAQDVFASSDASMSQMAALANSVGIELIQNENWQGQRRAHSITTQQGDTGKYPLPDDFAYMINQTGWDRANNVPLSGPLSPQDWQYLLGRDLVNSTIYASFRRAENEFWIFPQPPPVGVEIVFEYISRNWVRSSSGSNEYQDNVTNGGNVVLFEPYLFQRLLKVRFLEARGFDTTGAVAQFVRAFEAWQGKDKSAGVLNVARPGGSPLLDGFRNLPDSGFGQ